MFDFIKTMFEPMEPLNNLVERKPLPAVIDKQRFWVCPDCDTTLDDRDYQLGHQTHCIKCQTPLWLYNVEYRDDQGNKLPSKSKRRSAK